MFPTVVTSEIERALLDYLTTTFNLKDKALEAALFSFLQDGKTGMFKGPYLDVRLPFRKASEDWEHTSPLDYGPSFVPYLHQLLSFERLSSRDRKPENTLVTTGTGSGKTECFLYPLLDHCRRAALRGEHQGIKAIILYPMNALASDQAERLAKQLQHPALKESGVTAGLYVGGQGQHGKGGDSYLVDKREILRQSPPDILLTNYRMLDFLLMRPEDASLWSGNSPGTLQFLVLDELHTYDGAQGSDVACLIRRLKARLNIPQGRLCCVGTSATIARGGGAQDPKQLLASFATKIFAEPFGADSIVGEDRMAPNEAFFAFDEKIRDVYGLPEGDWAKLAPGQYESHSQYIDEQMVHWLGKRRSPPLLAAEVGSHPFMTKLLRALFGRERRSGPRHLDEVIANLSAEDPHFAELAPTRQRLLISSFVSLIAHARSLDARNELQPFLHVQQQLWLREVHGLLARVEPGTPAFAWQDELKPGAKEHWLPLVYCRECGFHGYAAAQREGEATLRNTPQEIAEVFLHNGNRGRVIELLTAAAEPVTDEHGQAELLPKYLCRQCLKVGFEPHCSSCMERPETLPIRLHPERDDKNKQRHIKECPACRAEDGLTFLASRAATLSSVAVSELFTTRYNADKKLLAFTDSVQDASHRAGFFASRTFRFTIRTAIQAVAEIASAPVPLDSFGHRLFEHWSQARGAAKAAALLLPPDLVEDQAYVAYFGRDKAGDLQDKHRPTSEQAQALTELLEKRSAWEVTRELGLAANIGRSLDATACSTISFEPARLDAAAAELLEHLAEHHRASLRRAPTLEATRQYLAGLWQRLRLKGGIFHPWLESYAKHDRSYLLSKAKNPRLSRFGPGSALPSFWVLGEPSSKSTYQALHSTPTARSWYRVWTSRCLGLISEQDASVNSMLDRAARSLRDHGLLTEIEGPAGRAVLGITPSSAFVTAGVSRLRCSVCKHQLTVALEAQHYFDGRVCLGYACEGGRYETAPQGDEQETYYQRLYKSGRAERVFTGEHTGLLDREEREALERAFKQQTRPDAPNLLTCTPTLEMGIDIGDLSAVMLCAVPPLPANYVQRVGRAGRSTGNATVLTLANRHPHDRYFYEQPYEMLRGDISPPGCFLDAPEMLARQVLAHAMDSWAKERERGHGAVIPARMNLLRMNADEAFPGEFWSYYQANKDRLAHEFVGRFGAEIAPGNAERLLQLSQGEGLAGAMKRAFAAVKDQLKSYTEQLKTLEARIKELEEDPSRAQPAVHEEEGAPTVDVEADLKELRESAHAYRRLRAELQNKYPLNVLTDAGVLPNYAFPEPGVTLSALLREPYDEDAPKTRGKKVEYLRPAGQALREFAPFNTFYAEGHKIRISQLDLGSKAEAIETWRLCRACHHMATEVPDVPAPAKCPRCGDASWSDVGQRRSLVRFRHALSVMNRLEASTAEDSEDRDRESYKLLELIDVDPAENCSGARLVKKDGMVFGIELLQRQLLREINFGRRSDTAKGSTLAGEEIAQRGFLVCKQCGKVSESEAKPSHTAACGVRRKNDKPDLERVFLYRDFRSEAIRLLLPVSQLEDAELLCSLQASLFLGFRKKFSGYPSHLGVSLVKESRFGQVRRFLVVYDHVPGGTGYLADLWKNDGILDVLERARDAMQSCVCVQDPTKDGCYRCLYAHQNSRDIPLLSRRRAIESIDTILALRGALEATPTLSDAPLDDLTESELERKFLKALEARAILPGRETWTPTQQGGKTCYVLSTPNSQWLIEPQVLLGSESGVGVPSKPDFVLRCLSKTDERPIALFCDGLRYHACPNDEHGRVWDDVAKRQALLASGQFRVWTITWKDIEEGSHVTTLLTRVQRDLYATLFAKDNDAVWSRDDTLRGSSSFSLLWEYLEHPEPQLWTKMAERFASSMLEFKKPWTADSIHSEQQALRNLPTRHATHLSEAKPADGAPKRWAGLDARNDAILLFQIPTPAVQKGDFAGGDLTLRLYDDAEARKQPAFEDSWRAFFHAWNVLQFHRGGLEAVTTELLTHTTDDAVAEAPPPRAPSAPPPGDVLDDYGRFAAEYRDGKHLPQLAELLRDAALPLPVDAAQLEVPVELEGLLAWPEQRLVLVQEPTASDIARWKDAGFVALDYDCDAETIRDAVKAAIR